MAHYRWRCPASYAIFKTGETYSPKYLIEKFIRLVWKTAEHYYTNSLRTGPFKIDSSGTKRLPTPVLWNDQWNYYYISDQNYLFDTGFSDDCSFNTGSILNRYNCRYWSHNSLRPFNNSRSWVRIPEWEWFFLILHLMDVCLSL